MNALPTVVLVSPVEAGALFVLFQDGEARRYDVTPMIERGGVFASLREPEAFEAVSILGNGIGIEWACGADLSGSSLYTYGTPVRVDRLDEVAA